VVASVAKRLHDVQHASESVGVVGAPLGVASTERVRAIAVADQLAARVDGKANAISRMTIAVPSGNALVARVCGDSSARDSSGYVPGVLRTTRGQR